MTDFAKFINDKYQEKFDEIKFDAKEAVLKKDFVFPLGSERHVILTGDSVFVTDVDGFTIDGDVENSGTPKLSKIWFLRPLGDYILLEESYVPTNHLNFL